MRRYDKKTNILKANLLAEQRYINELSQFEIQTLVSSQTSLSEILEAELFSQYLNDDERRIIGMAKQICEKLEAKLIGG